MNNIYLNRRPFEDSVKPIYPGNMPYLSQMIYDEYVFRKIRQAFKTARRQKEEKKKKKNTKNLSLFEKKLLKTKKTKKKIK